MCIVKEETQRNSHNCFNALAGYLQNMLSSKDYVIQVFKEEIGRKNTLIEQLIARQEELEEKLVKMEQILSYTKEFSEKVPEKVNSDNEIKAPNQLIEIVQESKQDKNDEITIEQIDGPTS